MNELLKQILNQIVEAGFEAYLVGGYPRDFYMGRETDDYDITTSATPEQLKTIFPLADMTDQKYGRITLQEQNYKIEITTYRKESDYIDFRFPEKIQFVESLEQDLRRRDFVINTLCMDQDGNFVDLLGARKDIDQKVIRTVGNAEQKIEEDSLRILRAIRFSATLDFELDSELLLALKKYKRNLFKLSYQRKKEELDKILVHEKGISLLKEFQEELEISGLEQVNVHTSLVGIWAQLTYSSHYEFSKQQKKEIKAIQELLEQDILDPFILYQYGHYYCGIVAEIKGISRETVLNRYKELPIHHRSEIAITPKELLQMVSKDMIGEVYQDLEVNILNGSLENIKIFLKKHIMNGRKN